MKTFSLNSDTTNRASFPIRGLMFKNSNYLRIWNQLTSYYDKVSYDNVPNKINNVFIILEGYYYFISQENILVVDGDKFIEDPVPVLQSVERFLHIPSFFTDQHFTHNGD